MAKAKTLFFCQNCGYESPKWFGRCPGCHEYNTMVEEAVQKKTPDSRFSSISQSRHPQKISDLKVDRAIRLETASREFNRVLGGGIVQGSLVLVGGDPGIGKSTLLLQVSNDLSAFGPVLYVSGEESEEQIKARADRLGIHSEQILIFSENNLTLIQQQVEAIQPICLIIDSIQTVYLDYIASAPGSVSQVRECTAQIMRLSKSQGIPTFIVGHVTKDGAIAGPRILEHMVDTVLYFEGNNQYPYRILRAVKNRFGSTNEIGVFEMKETGLEEVENPAGVFIADRSTGYSGTAIVAAMEGTRPILLEIQSLLAPTSFNNPKRTASGLDYNKLSLLIAVIEKRLGFNLQHFDAFVKVTGGAKVVEPAADLAIIMSLISSYSDIPIDPGDLFIGEVGLTGEVKRVSRIEERLKEAYKLGFKRAFVPYSDVEKTKGLIGFQVMGIKTIREVMDIVFTGHSLTKGEAYES